MKSVRLNVSVSPSAFPDLVQRLEELSGHDLNDVVRHLLLLGLRFEQMMISQRLALAGMAPAGATPIPASRIPAGTPVQGVLDPAPDERALLSAFSDSLIQSLDSHLPDAL